MWQPWATHDCILMTGEGTNDWVGSIAAIIERLLRVSLFGGLEFVFNLVCFALGCTQGSLLTQESLGTGSEGATEDAGDRTQVMYKSSALPAVLWLQSLIVLDHILIMLIFSPRPRYQNEWLQHRDMQDHGRHVGCILACVP